MSVPLLHEIAPLRLMTTDRYRIIQLTFLKSELAFETLDDARMFLVKHNAGFFTNPNDPDDKDLDCRAAHSRLKEVFEEKYRKVGIKGAI